MFPPEISHLVRDVHLIRGGAAGRVKENEVILADAGRVVDLVPYTVMCQIAASKKWTPLENADLGDTTGKAIACGVLMNPDGIPAASLTSDFTGAMILYGGGCELEADFLVFDAGSNGQATQCTLDSIATAITGWPMRVEEALALHGIYVRSGYWASIAP